MNDVAEILNASNRRRQGEDFRPFLKQVNLNDLRRKIRAYETRAKRHRTPDQIRRDLIRVLMPVDGASFMLPCFMRQFAAGAPFFRGRILDDRFELTIVDDVWEAPPRFATPGRLNQSNESLLYTSFGRPSTAAYETRVKLEDVFSIAEYRARKPFVATSIGDAEPVYGLTPREQIKLSTILRFIEDAFTQKASPDESHVYTAPEVIVKDYFDLPAEVTKAWSYRSTVEPGGTGLNVCFRPDAGRESLELLAVRRFRCVGVDPADFTIRVDLLETLIPDRDGVHLNSVSRS